MKKNILLICVTVMYVLVHASANAQKTESKFSFGVKIYGHGKPMILIPGLKGDGPATYATTVAHYKDHYTCYVITLAAFAGQPASKRDSELLKGQRDELIEYVKEKHLDKPVLVGFSFGGVLALWMESTAPDLFGKLVDIDGVPFEASVDDSTINVDSFKLASEKVYHSVRNLSPKRKAYYDSLVHSAGYRKEGLEFLKSMISDTTKIPMVMDWDSASDVEKEYLMEVEMDTLDLRNSIAYIKSPILVLGSWFGWDKLKTKEAVQAAYTKQFAKAKDYKIVFSEYGKHFLMWNDYDWYIKEIDDFLK